jgi:hypothetical protein
MKQNSVCSRTWEARPYLGKLFAQDVENVSISERHGGGQAALELGATPQQNILRTGLGSLEALAKSKVIRR